MKKIFSFAKKKKGFSPNSSDTGSVLSVGYEIKEKDLSKIHKAASSGDLSKLKQLAKKNDLSQLDKENRTPLHIACANGHVEIVQFLVESKAKLNLCDNQNRSPLMKAVQCQQERCVVTLLEHNADPNLVDINGNTALHLAALIPSISMAVQLLEHEANVNAQNKDGCTPLTLAVTENHVEMAEFLLKEGADMNAADQGERTSLMIAACNGQISMVRLLLRYNADVTIKDEKGWTSDDYAVMNGHHACSHLIIEHGTKGKTQPSPSHFASAGKKPAAVLGSPRHMAQAGPALGQPATDREELQLSGAAEAGKVDEDDSQAESISRASRRGAGDSWPSSDEDDLDFSPKKTQKPNLKKLMSASQKGRTDEGGLSDVAFTSKPRGNSQEEGESDSPEGQEEEESDEEDEDEEDEVDEEDEGDDDDEDDEEEDEDAEEESEEDEEVDEEQDEEEEEEDDMEKDDVAVAHIRNDGINDEELPRPVTAGADADIEEEADVEQPLVEGHDPHQSAAGTDQAAVTEDQEPMENVFRVKIRNDNGNDHEDEGLSKNIINEADNGTLGILDFGEDCVVSAIRVESGYSDEEEDHGNKENSDKDHVEARSPQEPKVLPQQNVGWNVQAEEPPFPDMSWGDDNNESDDLAHSPEEPKDPPLHTGLTLSGKSPEEPVSPDVSRRDEKDRVENSAKQKFIGSMSPVLAEPNLQKSSDKTLLGKEMDEPTSPVESWVEKKGVHVRASGHSHDISISGSHRKPMTLPQKNVGTNLLSKRRDQPSSPELSWGDEKDEDNEGPTYNDEALEMQPAAVIESKASDSWDSDEGNLKSEHLQPAGKVAEQQEYSAPVSLIVGHYEGPYEPKEDSGKIAAGSSKANEERVESPCMSAEKQSESDIDWGDEISNHEQLPQTAIDDVELDPPLGEDLEGLMVRATEDKRATNLKIYNAGASKDGISTEDDEEDEDEEDDDDEETKEDENEENKNIEVPDINTNAQDGQKSHGASVKQKSEPSKDVKRDFLSELGLEGGEEEEDSPWDSESGSDSPGKLQGVAHTPVKAHKVMASISEEKNEDPFYIPSFLRGSRHCRMANLEIPRRLVRTGDLSAPDLQDGGLEKKPVLKAQPAPVLPKPAEPKDDAVKNKDLMEELGLDDADDLEDASDWDTASTASRTIAGRKLASPSGEEPGERPPAAQSKAQGPPSPTARTPPLPSPRSSNPSTTLQPQPHPRARRLLPAKAESEEESDWDSESGTPASSPRKTGKLQPNLPEDKAISKPDILPHPRQLSPEDGGSRGSVESKEEPHKVGTEKKSIISEVQRPGGLWDGEGSSRQSVQESQVVKPPQTSRKQQLSEKGNGVTPKDKTREGLPQRDSPKSPKSGSTASKQEGDGVNTGERNAQRPPPRPRQAAHANGDPLSVFDDSTVSETSEDDGRSAAAGNRGNKEASEREMADDLDELTQSSDTPTEDEVSPTSGYRNASLLIQQLDSSSVDSVSMVKLQNMFHEYERTIQRERGRYSLLADKVSRLEKDRAELRRALEETREGRSVLERRQVELETDLNNLKFALKQEQEKHRNAAMLYDKSREQLRKKEEQQRAEAEERQRTELAMRNLELEMRALVNNMKQLEEDRNEAQRMLNQERSARALQEGVLSSHLRKQKEIEEENRRNFNKSSEAMSQLSEASDREKELMQQSRGLQEEVTSLQMELEHARSHSRQEEGRLSEESEALRERLEDVRRDLKLSEEALAQTVFQCNSQLSGLKAEASVAAAKLEHERQAREKLEAEAESARARLASALQEVERSQAGLAEAERALQRERDERQRAREKLDAEAAAQRDAIHGLSQRLGKAEAKANGLENECHRSALALTEKTLLLETAEREREQALARLAERDAALLAEREQRSKAAARQEALQERLGQAQSENMLLRQQLEEAHSRGAVKERAVSDAQERFGDMLAKLRSDSEERVHMVEERSRELAEKNTELREQVRKQEQENAEREAKLRQLQQELADSLKKLSMSEASLEVNTRYRSDLEDEKLRLQKEMDRLKGKLQESEEQFVQSERRLHSLKSTLDDKEREIIASSQKLQEVLSASTAAEKTIKQLEEAVQRLEIENARLEAAAKQQTNRIEVLQKGVQEAALPSDSSPGGMVRNRLEGLVTDLQGAKINLEDQLSREVQKQSVLSHNAQGSHQLWEEELKSRSRLGLRLAELEKEKEDLSTQMDIERKKVKKIAEQKKSVDVRLEQEMKRNTDLQKEMYRLRTLVKTAKKKLREQDSGDVASPLSSLRGEMGHRQMDADAAVGRMKVDELSLQLEKEALKCSRLEAVNGELKEQLSSLRSLSKSHERLERSKRQLEEEVSGLRRQMETSMMDQSQAEQYRRETEERARQEIRHKLEEVNLFLQTQAASQEALEQIKAANEASLRSQLEQRVRDLDSELSRLRTSQQDSLSQRDSTKTELERYRELYAEELRLRKSLGAKLERSNERLAEANGRLLSERQRSKSLITSGIVNGGLAGPSLDMGPLGSVGAYGATLGPLNRSLSLGGSFLSPVGEGHNSRVEAYLAKMQSELEKNISKELDHAAAELEGGSARLSPVGSAAGSQKTLNVDQDPVTRATQQYLEVLKKNYMI
ncbi:ankyrin repeat domain-containing protein 26 isoform X7 [Anguilla rostrata]|uniref:ankyrin repeat domain-containing protein 26 isoform X7 n=1 Tax=Anguilla rostrata TaxID=7938 RepID=UPI0030D26FEE